MDWTKIPAGQLHAAEQRLRVAFGENASIVVEQINSDLLFAGKIVNYALLLSTSLNPQWLRAREIMGKNFFGVEEAIQYLKVNPTRQQFLALSEILFSETVLGQSRDTHILVAVFPISILEIRNQNKGLFYGQDWYNKQSFAKECGEVSWQLVRKTPVDNSFSKNWQKQQALIDKDDEVPTTQVMVYTIIGHFLATGERLFENTYVRTSFVASDGSRVPIGYFDSNGLRVSYSWDVNRDDDLGVSSARKS